MGPRIPFAPIVWAGPALSAWIAGEMIAADLLVAGRLALMPHRPAIAGGADALLVVGIASRLAPRRPALREEPRG